jgi:hypothetical protein
MTPLTRFSSAFESRSLPAFAFHAAGQYLVYAMAYVKAGGPLNATVMPSRWSRGVAHDKTPGMLV